MDLLTLKILNYSIIIDSIILIVSVILQVRDSGLGGVFGGGGGENFRSKRGMEKIFYYTTIVSAILLITLCLVWSLLYKPTVTI